MSDTINIGITDDQLLFRQGIAALIKSEPGFSLVLDAENGEDCLAQLDTLEEKPHIILADLEMPGMDGMELNEQLQKKYPGIKVIVLSVHSGERLIARMIQQGASGYLLKNCDKSELLTALRTVFASGFYINNHVLEAIQRAAHVQTPLPKNINGIPVELSAREKEILLLICQQFSTPEIAEKLFLSARTVEGHRNNLLQKTGCRNTAGLVLFAVKYQLFKVAF